MRAIPLWAAAAPPHHEFAKGIAHYCHGKVCRNWKALEVWDERLKRSRQQIIQRDQGRPARLVVHIVLSYSCTRKELARISLPAERTAVP